MTVSLCKPHSNNFHVTLLHINTFCFPLGAHEKQITLDSQNPAELGAHLTDLIPINGKI